jgi:hypothetical protein
MGTTEDVIMRMITTAIAALGFAGAMAIGTPSATLAQGLYFQGPGVEFGIGRPAYRERYYRYYDYDRPSAYSYGRSYYGRPYVEQRRYRYRYDWD